MAITPKLMTADQLLDLPDDGMQHELVRGVLRTMAPPGLQHGRSGSSIGRSLDRYVEANRLGEVILIETGDRLTRDPDTVRVPDVGFLSNERLREVGDVVGYVPGAPDLVVEVISPNDRYAKVDEKVAAWIEHGTRLVFVVNPRRRTVAVHRPGQPIRVLGRDDVLDGEDVVPGWSMAVRDLFR
ncbi:MAG: Uma2 family endonuclease [Chloroflexota bacterium]